MYWHCLCICITYHLLTASVWIVSVDRFLKTIFLQVCVFGWIHHYKSKNIWNEMKAIHTKISLIYLNMFSFNSCILIQISPKFVPNGFVVHNGCNAIILNIEVSFQQHIYAPPGFNEFSGPFYLHDLTLITAWISKHMPSKLLGEITYPLMNCNGCADEG